MRAWIELPRDAGWADVRLARASLHKLGYLTAELRGTGPVLLRLSTAELEAGEVLRMPGR